MIFLDANVPMYAGGSEHPLKQPCVRVLELVQESPSEFTTSAEVLQELIHRYTALRRWAVGRELLANFASLFRGRIHPIYASDVLGAADLVDSFSNLSARDLLHVAVMRRVGISRIVSTDAKYDHVNDLERLDPALVAEWEHTVTEDPR